VFFSLQKKSVYRCPLVNYIYIVKLHTILAYVHECLDRIDIIFFFVRIIFVIPRRLIIYGELWWQLLQPAATKWTKMVQPVPFEHVCMHDQKLLEYFLPFFDTSE